MQNFRHQESGLGSLDKRERRSLETGLRREALKQIARQGRPTTRQLVETLARPYVDLIGREPVRGIQWLKIVAQLITADDPHILEDPAVALVSGQVQELVRRRYPGVAHDDLVQDWRLAVITLIQMLSMTPADEVTTAFADSSYKRTVVSFVIGGIDASMASLASGVAAKKAS